MRAAVISDLHLGTKWGTEREQDPFDQAQEAFERALELGAQLILVPGDIFELRIPRQEMWAKAMRILSLPLAREGGKIKLADTIDKNPEEVSPVALMGVPIVALHGNHERRSAGLVNPVQALEAAGLLMYLHHNTLVLDTPAGRVAIHGMSNVPERHARDVFSTWNPRPVEGATNILMLHQSLGQYVYSDEEHPTMEVADLPPGFDLYICGHVHYHDEDEFRGTPLLFPGSTVRTQLIPIEAERPKGFYMLDLGEKLSYEFVELRSVRDFFYEEKIFDGASAPEISRWVRSSVRELLEKPRRNPNKAPLIRFRLRGSLAKETSRSELDTEALEEEFLKDAIVNVSKRELASPGLEEKIKLLRELREQRMSVEDMAMELLDSNLRDVGYDQILDARALYGLLVEDMVDEALDVALGAVGKLSDAELGGES